MKKHQTLSDEDFMKIFAHDITLIRDTNLIVLRSHIVIEYQINEIILKIFKKPELILNKYFQEKLKILEALGIFCDYEELLRDINIITSFRNEIAHNFIVKNEKEFIKVVDKLKMLRKHSLPKVYKEIMQLRDIDYITRFGVTMIPIIQILISLKNKLKTSASQTFF